jgi:hypothetical protein
VTKKTVVEEKIRAPEEPKVPAPKGTCLCCFSSSSKSPCITFHKGEKEHSFLRTRRQLQMAEIAIYILSYNLAIFALVENIIKSTGLSHFGHLIR